MEAAKRTIKDFTGDAEATVIRSIQAQREANLEVQRLHREARLERQFRPPSRLPVDGKEAWRTQLGATLDLHRVIREVQHQLLSETRAGWSRVTDFGSGGVVSKRPPPSSAPRPRNQSDRHHQTATDAGQESLGQIRSSGRSSRDDRAERRVLHPSERPDGDSPRGEFVKSRRRSRHTRRDDARHRVQRVRARRNALYVSIAFVRRVARRWRAMRTRDTEA